jgi:hypothetical protein
MEETVMSLLTESFEPCVMLNKRTTKDSYGSYFTIWEEGAEFDAAISFDTSIEARTAGAQGVTNLFTVLTGKEITLQYHDVFQRIKDGKIFRVGKSDGYDKKTPKSAGLQLRLVTAEEWELTDDG